MTLQEKFFNWFPKQDAEFISEECEKIADEFAIGFADWIGINNYKKYSNGWANIFTKAMTEKELLEIYKKEKGL